MNDAVVALAVLAAAAPARFPAAAPDAGVRRAATAQALVVAALVALAAVGSPLLDALDISDPNAAIAAGVVLALTAVLDVLRPAPRPVVLPAGPTAVLVPLAWPIGLRPAGAVVAVAAGADGGTPAVVVGALVAAAAAVVLVARRPSEPVRAGLGALIAVVGVAVGIDLLVDGVLDV